MSKIVYNKLVRDKIPEIIDGAGKIAKISKLSGVEFEKALNQKLLEECKEYIESGDLEEIADILEVLYALMNLKGVSKSSVEKMRIDKAKARGAFDERIFLKYVENK